MAWIYDTYSMTRGHLVPGVVTGKPIFLGGSQGRNEATARGCVYVTRCACDVLKIDHKRATAAIQGFGNAGSIAAELLAKIGMKVIAVSDSKGGIRDPKDSISRESLRTKIKLVPWWDFQEQNQ